MNHVLGAEMRLQTSVAIPQADRNHPLQGIAALEFGGGLAAALTGRLLAEQGALVTRIERPETPSWVGNGPYLRAGKGCTTLDLGSPAGLAEAEALVADADVLIDNFRPGVMERLGLGPARAHALNPRLVYLRLPGFASADPAWRDLAAWEGVLGAACGLFTDVNISRATLGLPPVYTALPHASVYGAVHGAIAVAFALAARGADGPGDVIEVPLAAAGASAMGSAAMRITPQPERYDIPDLGSATRRMLPGLRRLLARAPETLQRRFEAAADRMTPPLMDSYRCADGRLLYVFAVDHDRFANRLLWALGLEDWARTRGIVTCDPYRPGAASDRHNLAETTRLAPALQRALRVQIAARLATRSAAAWKIHLIEAGVPCSVLRTLAEWRTLQEVAQAGIIAPDGTPGPAAWVRAQPGNAGLHTRPTPGPRLAGAVVLDLTSMVAGPVCARTLAEYGARVVRIDSPHPHHGPRLTCWFGVDVNQGKESLLLDLADPRGRAVLDRLLPRADVLLHNFSPSACARLGLDDSTLHQVNPRLVVAGIGALRGPVRGPWEERKGYDPVLQAASGIMLRYGGGRPVRHGIASCVDYLGGYLAAWGVALGLLARGHGGGEVTVETSLAQAAMLIQAPFAATDPASEPTGQWAWGTSALDRLYLARDGWVFLAAPPTRRSAVLAGLGLDPDGPADAAAIARAVRRRTRAALREAFGDDELAVVPVDPLAALPDEPAPTPGTPIADAATLRAVAQPGPDGTTLRTLLPTYARARSAPLLHLAPAPKPGTDTVRLLAESGAGAAEIELLLREGIAATSLHARLLPD